MKSAVLVCFLLTVAMAMVVFPVAAAPAHPPWGGFVNSGGVPAGSTLVVNIVYKVVNDEDSGLAGYWALDNYNKQVQVWQAPDGTFYAVARYEGSWQTFANVRSPGNTGTESKDASGTFEGGWVGTFTATGFTPTFGNVGTYDFGGSATDVQKSTYGNGQSGPTSPFDWMGTYFTGIGSFTMSEWGWSYHYRGQTWNNYSTGNSGDIVA